MAKPARPDTHTHTARTWLATYADGHTDAFSAADPKDARFQATHDTRIRFVGTGKDRQIVRTVTDLPAPPINLRPQFAQV